MNLSSSENVDAIILRRQMNNFQPFFSDQPELQLASSLPPEKRIQLGQVFTPYAIAKPMVRWVTSNGPPTTLLEPALGLGIFTRALLEMSAQPVLRVTGYEIDTNIANLARKLFKDFGYTQIDIINSSFLSSSWDTKYDSILCNPPYHRFRGLPGRDELGYQVRTRVGIKVSRAANLYVFFLIKAVHQLADGGRAAFILPYEFLNADYGQMVKQYLLDEGVLRKVLILNDGIHPFANVITTTCILCLERNSAVSHPEVLTCRSLEEISTAVETTPSDTHTEAGLIHAIPSAKPANKKWLIPGILSHEYNLKTLVPLSTFGRVMRGIATGDNKYFLLTERQRLELGLGLSCVLPCLSKSNLAAKYIFSTDHFADLIQSEKPVWLFRAYGNEQDPAVQKYLAEGECRGSNHRYLTKNRSPWYGVEDRPPAPLLATTFSRNGIRWVRNEAGVRFLTAFHGFYPHPDTNLDLLTAYLLTPVSQRILAQNQRDVGNGLRKFEPNDLNNGLVADITRLKESVQKEALDIYAAVVAASRAKQDTSSTIKELDRIFTGLITN